MTKVYHVLLHAILLSVSDNTSRDIFTTDVKREPALLLRTGGKAKTHSTTTQKQLTDFLQQLLLNTHNHVKKEEKKSTLIVIQTKIAL